MNATIELCGVCDDPITETKPGVWVHDGPARSGIPWNHVARPRPLTTGSADVATES